MSQYNLKVSDLYKLIIGDGFNLFIDSEAAPTSIAQAKWWDGTQWRLVYDVTVGTTKFNRIKYYNGSGWVNASLK
jgi:hypothetical protein